MEALPSLRATAPFSDGELLRFWLASKRETEKAIRALSSTLAWRSSQPWGAILASQGLAHTVRVIGEDEHGLPVYRVAPGKADLARLGSQLQARELADAVVRGYEGMRRVLGEKEADSIGLTLLVDLRKVRAKPCSPAFLSSDGVGLLVDWECEEHSFLPRPWPLFKTILGESLLSRVVVITSAADRLPLLQARAHDAAAATTQASAAARAPGMGSGLLLSSVEYAWWLRSFENDVARTFFHLKQALEWRRAANVASHLWLTRALLEQTPSHGSLLKRTADMQRLVNDADDPIDRKMLKEQRLDEALLSSFSCVGNGFDGQPVFVLSTSSLEKSFDVLGAERIARFTVRCFEHVRQTLLEQSIRRSEVRQTITLLVDLSGLPVEDEKGRGSHPRVPQLLVMLKWVHEVCSVHFAVRVEPLLVSHHPLLSRVWFLLRLFLSESLKRRMHIAPSDAELLSFLSPHLPPHLVPFSLRQRCLADLLNQRPTRSQLLARGILRATLGHPQATEIAEKEESSDEMESRFEGEGQQQAVAMALMAERLPHVADAELLRFLRASKFQASCKAKQTQSPITNTTTQPDATEHGLNK
ncbi:MAG: hypothetical protein SGPRY_003211 [Prymnesium sp.]